MKTLLTAVIIGIILFGNIGTIYASSTQSNSQTVVNHHFPQWVPANVNDIILFSTGGWLKACGVNSLPLNWNREWVHMSRNHSLPTWNTPQFTSGRNHQGILHPTRTYLSLVAVKPDGSWNLAQPSTTLAANGYDIFWANLSTATANSTPRKVETHFIDTVIQPLAPLWYTSRFSNNNRRNQTSNFSVQSAIYNFYNQNLSNTTQVYSGWNQRTGYAVDRQTTAAFRSVLVEGFRNDSILQAKPFSINFVEEVVNNLHFYFANRGTGQSCVGRYNPNLGHESHIWVATGRTATCFTRTALHELGHAFGLGETLADLQKEVLMGANESRRATHNLAYNATFDRMLLNRVGATTFWAAAYHSNKEYGNLWDANFGNIITHAELEAIRGVSLTGKTNANIRNAFASMNNGTPLKDASCTLFGYMQTLLSQPNSVCATTFAQFRALVNLYVSFANNHHIAASHSVIDTIIESHNTRFAA